MNFNRFRNSRLSFLEEHKNQDHFYVCGNNSVLLSAPHGVSQVRLGKQKVAEIKGMQLSLNIADNDMAFKAKNVRKFLSNGDKVKVSLRMFGRQLANPQLAFPIMEKFCAMLEDVAEVTSKPELNGRQITMVLSPKKSK